jgi:hypothetical protein
MVQPDEEEGIGGNTPGEPAPPGVDEQSPAEAGRVDTPKKKSIESLALAITIGSMTVTASLTFGPRLHWECVLLCHVRVCALPNENPP